MARPDPTLHVVILAGGIGSRFWPASTPARPKPLLALGSPDRTLIAETVARARTLAPFERVAILAGAALVEPIRNAVPDLPAAAFQVEPRARGTGPVLAWAAHRIHREDPAGVLVSLHSDHRIHPEGAFTELVRHAAAIASERDRLFTVAAVPDRPETGYGYIRPGSTLPGPCDAFEVEAFVEKPDAGTAARYIAEGCLWNTGLFILPVARFLEEVRTHAPEIGRHLEMLDRGDDAGFFEAVPTISVDEAVLERSERVGAARATFAWDDVGSWEALTRSRTGDAHGNVAEGEVHAVESSDTIAWAEDGPVVLFGVSDLVVVRSHGVTLVASRDRAPDLKSLLAKLPEELQDPTPDDGRSATRGGLR